MNVLIIDDEKAARDLLVHYIKTYFPDIIDIHTATGIHPAKTIIKKENPDIIFLDIEMPTGNGLDLFDLIGPTNASVIITSAYDDYAIKAIKKSVNDYLLKPIDIKEFINAVTLVIKNRQELNSKKSRRIPIRGQNDISYVEEDKIKYIISERAYTNIHMIDNSKYVVTKPLSHFESILDAKIFFRLHRSYIINLTMISRIIKRDGGHVEMLDGKQFKIAKLKREMLISKLGKK